MKPDVASRTEDYQSSFIRVVCTQLEDGRKLRVHLGAHDPIDPLITKKTKTSNVT